MRKLFRQDKFILGIVIGVIAPWITLGILYSLNILFRDIILKVPNLIQLSTLELIAIVVNVIMMRQYMVKLKYDKTGRGLLFITFIYIIAYAVHEFVIK
jgi:hypothetical protein